MARSGLYRVAPGVRSRRKAQWGTVLIGDPDSAMTRISATGSTVFPDNSAANVPQTIVRLRGLLSFALVSATTQADGFIGAVGLGIASAEAVGVGVTALPGPVDDPEEDWLWWHPLHVTAQEVAAAERFKGLGMLRIPVDSKAMRKLEVNDTLFGVIQVTEIGSASMDCYGMVRNLVKLV